MERASSVLILVVVATRPIGREQVQNSQTSDWQVSPLQIRKRGLSLSPRWNARQRDGFHATHKLIAEPAPTGANRVLSCSMPLSVLF
jgi:hypothetical protein